MSHRKKATRSSASPSPQVTFAIDGIAGTLYSALREGIAAPGFLLSLVAANLTEYEWGYVSSLSGTYSGSLFTNGPDDVAETATGDGWDGSGLSPGEFEGASAYKSLLAGSLQLICTAVSYRFRDGAGAWRYVEVMAAQQDLGTSRGVCGQIMYKPDDEMDAIVKGGVDYLAGAVNSRMRANGWYTSMNRSSDAHSSSAGRDESWYVSASTSMATGMTEATVYVHQDVAKTTATGIAVMNADGSKVKSITVTSSGSGYAAPPTVIVVGPGEVRTATAVPVMDEGGDRVVGVSITDPGSGYKAKPGVEFGSP